MICCKEHLCKQCKINKTKKKYWYRMFIGECPICGHDASYKEIMYTKKPKNKKDRVFYLSNQNTYDYCLERGNV